MALRLVGAGAYDDGMKALPWFAMIVASFMAVTTTLAQDTQAQDASKDSVDLFKELAACFPKQSVAKSNPNVTFRIEVADYDVKKTDSLVNPIIGLLNFSTTEPNPFADEAVKMNLQMVFAWQDGKWRFVKLLNTKNGIDFTNMGAGEDLMGAGEMLDFLKPYRDDQAQ